MPFVEIWICEEDVKALKGALPWIAEQIKRTVPKVFGKPYVIASTRVDAHILLWTSEPGSLRIEINATKYPSISGKEQQLHETVVEALCTFTRSSGIGKALQNRTLDLYIKIGSDAYFKKVQLLSSQK